MWGNITGVMGKALEKVQMIQSELENQMDAAVGASAEGNKMESDNNPETSPSVLTEVTKTAAPIPDPEQLTNVNLDDTPANSPLKGARSISSIEEPNVSKSKKNNGKSTKKGKSQPAPVPTGTVNTVAVPAPIINPSSSNDFSTDALAAKHNAHINELEERHRTHTTELESNHKKTLSTWMERVLGLEEHSKIFNKETLDSALADASKSFEQRLLKQQKEFDNEKKGLREQLQAAEATSNERVSKLRSEYDGKLASVQAQLAARDEGGDQVSILTAEFTKQIDALQAGLSSKDDALEQQAAHLRRLQSDWDSKTVDWTSEIESLFHRISDKDNEIATLKEEKSQVAEIASSDAPKLLELTAQVESLSADLHQKSTELADVTAQLQQKETDLKGVFSDLVKVKEALAERERALETATKNLSEQHKLCQDATQKIADLQAEIVEKDARSRQVQSNTAEEEENKKLLVRYQEQLKEQGERLAAFEKEGQSLAKKQSEMEKVVRKCKGDLKEKDSEIQKLKDSKEQLVKAIEQTQDVLKRHEADSNNASKSLSAMQAVSQASTEKLVRLEAELTAKTEEYASQRRALEAAWTEATDLKRTITELKADRDDLRKRIGEGTSKVMETESSRRDIEQREAVLRATSKQLQDSLQRQMQESAAREERLREEVNEMRKRWQEAIGSRESMASELGNATAPLLRQISSLQESIRVKSEHWQNVESSLSERALRAENAAEVAENKRSMMEDQLLELKQQHSTTCARLQDCQTQLAAAEATIERIKKREAAWSEEKAELDSKLAMEAAQRQSLQSTLREIEIRHKVEVQELQEASLLVKSQGELELAMRTKDLDALREELAAVKLNSTYGGMLSGSSPMKKHTSSSKLSLNNLHKAAQNTSHERLPENSSVSTDSDHAHYSSTGADLLATSALPSKSCSVNWLLVCLIFFSVHLWVLFMLCIWLCIFFLCLF